MADRSLEERVTILEQKVESLQKLPDEMRLLTAKVSDLRVEVADFRTEFLQFRDEIRSAFSAVASRSELSSFATRTELYQVRDAVMAQSRALHEDLVDKIKVLGEHRNGTSEGSR